MMRVVSTLEEGRAILVASRQSPVASALELVSPPFAACYAGVNYYRKLVDALQREFPGVGFTFTLCCGDDAAVAYDARRMGFTHILCSSPLDPLANTAKP